MKNIATVLLLIALSAPAFAASPKLLGTYKDWKTYTLNEKGGKVCYMVSTPKKAEGNYTQRGDIYAIITHRPGENTKNVFSYMTGYPYKTGSDVSLTFDGRKKIMLFTHDSTAWAPDAATDNTIVDAIRAGSTMSVKGTSSRGTLTTDTFSLSGSSAAYKKISSACGY